MTIGYIKYRSDYKYQLANKYELDMSITPPQKVESDFLNLSLSGKLVVKKGYAWDGPSGPALDSRIFMRGSLVHDALYQLMRRNEAELPAKKWRKKADQELRRICREDGMSRIRAWWVFQGVHWFAKGAAEPSSMKVVVTAP